MAGLTAPARLADELEHNVEASTGKSRAKEAPPKENGAVPSMARARERLETAKVLFEDGLISEEDYSRMKAEVLTTL